MKTKKCIMYVKTKSVVENSNLKPDKYYRVYGKIKDNRFVSGIGLAVMTESGCISFMCSSFFE